MRNQKPHAIVLPYPYQGHVTPMINLSTKLASRGFLVTFIQTEFIHHSITKAQNLHPPADADDIFAEARKSGLGIRYTTISDGFPLDFDRDLMYDHYWETMFRDFPLRVGEIAARIIEADDGTSSFFVIADTFSSWLATFLARKYDLVHVSLWTEPAIVFDINYHLDLLTQNGHSPCTGDDGNDFVINYIPGIQSIGRRDLMSYIQDPNTIPMLTEAVVKGFEHVKQAEFIICNTVQELEAETLAALNQKHPTYAIGPVNFYAETGTPKSLWSESDCTLWLNSKPPGSVLYISFGSVVQSDKEEIAQLAYGLRMSGVYFVWVLRPNITQDYQNGIDILPSGFEDSTKDEGLIVPWCNQNRVLSDPATGGFLTHCGWNSILESVWHGVPMICYPFLVDQLTNRKLVVDDWKIGINLCDGGQDVNKEEVAAKINILMRGEMKEEVKKVSQKVHDSLSNKQGSSCRNFDQFVEDVKTKLNCNC